jgi:hypothetical protein
MTLLRSASRGIAVALLLATPVHALDWAETQLNATVRPGSDVAMATYHFINASKSVVHINGIHTDCGCTDATPSASDVPAGEAGSIEVVFTIGQRTGKQRKEILVETSDAKQPVKLILNVALPESAKPAKEPPAAKP